MHIQSRASRLVARCCRLAFLFILSSTAIADGPGALEKIRSTGVLKVALYNNLAPFSAHGKGIDVDIATALAEKLGVKMVPLWFDGDDNMEDDFRNMVWKGHYLGYGPADVLMHAPVDREYIAKVDKVKIFAPYHRERYAVGHLVDSTSVVENFDALATQPYSVEGDTLPAAIMLSRDGGRYRDSMKTFKSGSQAVLALRSGAVAICIAQQGELESGLLGDTRFAIDLPPDPVLLKRQWAIGLAVKADSNDLAEALQNAMNQLASDGSIKRIMQNYGVQPRQP